MLINSKIYIENGSRTAIMKERYYFATKMSLHLFVICFSAVLHCSVALISCGHKYFAEKRSAFWSGQKILTSIDAQQEYMRNHQHERSLAPGFTNWPGACHWFLTNCVTHRVLHKSIEKLENLKQRTGQSVQDYHKELQNKSKYRGEEFDNSTLFEIFWRGVLPTLSSEADQNYNRFAGPSALIELRDFSSSAEETHNGLIRTARETARSRDGVPLANLDGHSRTSLRNSALATRDFFGNSQHVDDIKIVDDSNDSSSPVSEVGLPEGRNYESTFENDSNKDEADPINAIDIRTIRFGLRKNGDRPIASQQRANTRSKTSNQFFLPLTCHLRFEEGHIKPKCPCLDVATEPQYLKSFQNNWDSLASWVQLFVIRRANGSFTHVKITLPGYENNPVGKPLRPVSTSSTVGGPPMRQPFIYRDGTRPYPPPSMADNVKHLTLFHEIHIRTQRSSSSYLLVRNLLSSVMNQSLSD